VASQLRTARSDVLPGTEVRATALTELAKLQGTVLLCEEGRKAWWGERRSMLDELGVAADHVAEIPLPHREWAWGKLGGEQLRAIGKALSECSQIWVESPEVAWFLAKAVKEGTESLNAEVRLVWQRFYGAFTSGERGPATSFHESWHLARLLPRLGYSIPMHERGLLPFHHGWNVLDCGGESFYRLANPTASRGIGERFLEDLVKDGRALEKIVCQSLACVEHLRGLTDVEVSYWLDELEPGRG
jgi:hypothetical protein